jgi:cholesterol oxidase
MSHKGDHGFRLSAIIASAAGRTPSTGYEWPSEDEVASADFRRHREAQPPPRPLRLPMPEHHWHDGESWSKARTAAPILCLTRYQGGLKGPIVLAHGFCMSARQYTLPYTEQNFTEYLVQHGYDVWLFDYRASIDLPGARSTMTLDDIAQEDWPRAIAEVRRITGASDLQVFAHCVGSMTMLMALLAGMKGVRHAVASQLTLHPVVPLAFRLKARINLARWIEDLGTRLIDPSARLNFSSRIINLLLWFNPLLNGERCQNSICRWLFGFYGPTHHHSQLSRVTHEQMADFVDVGSLRLLNHLNTVVRHGHVVDHEGAEIYLPHVKRLAVPITFVSSSHNKLFRPETSRRTLRWLQEHNEPDLYDQIVLDGYGHLDPIIGVNVHREVFPALLRSIERYEPADADSSPVE